MGSASFEVEVVDEDGLVARQSFTLIVRNANVAPEFTSTPVTEVAAGGQYQYNADAIDTEDQVTYSLVDAPVGAGINPLTGIVAWRPELTDLDQSFTFTIRATDERGLSTDQTFTVDVGQDAEAPVVGIVPNNTLLLPGDTVIVRVSAADNVGVESLVVNVDGTSVTLDSDNRFTYTVTEPGLPQIEATATDAAGNSTTETFRLRVIDLNDTEGPVVSIDSPAINSQVTYLTDIAISVTADDLDNYVLEYSLRGTGQWRTLATGTAEVAGEIVATFDPTLLQNDIYDLRLTATDFSGNATAEEIFFNVEGQAKLGNYALEFTDLVVPLAGIPITITRQYDTLNANQSGDFGFGWNLSISEANIRETIPVTQSELDGVPPLFGGATPFFDGARVYVTTPDGQRVGFTFRPEPTIPGLLQVGFAPRFVADVDTNFELEVPEIPLSQNADGTFGLYLIGGTYNPREYTLVSTDQIRYTYDQFDGLQTVTDRNGVTLEYREDGIFKQHGGIDRICT